MRPHSHALLFATCGVILNIVVDAKHHTTRVHTLNILWMTLHQPSTFKECSQVPSEIRGMEQTSDKSSAVEIALHVCLCDAAKTKELIEEHKTSFTYQHHPN